MRDARAKPDRDAAWGGGVGMKKGRDSARGEQERGGSLMGRLGVYLYLYVIDTVIGVCNVLVTAGASAWP
jgi:hypothetical protein